MAEILELFDEAQELAGDSAGLYPGPEALEGMDRWYVESMWCHERAEVINRRNARRDRGRKRSGKYLPTKKRLEIRICEGCGYPFDVTRGARNWTTQRFCNAACRQKGYRTRRTLLKLGNISQTPDALPGVFSL